MAKKRSCTIIANLTFNLRKVSDIGSADHADRKGFENCCWKMFARKRTWSRQLPYRSHKGTYPLEWLIQRESKSERKGRFAAVVFHPRPSPERLSTGVKFQMDGKNLWWNFIFHLRSQVFFRAGVLGQLEEIRDERLGKIVSWMQAWVRGYLSRKQYRKLGGQRWVPLLLFMILFYRTYGNELRLMIEAIQIIWVSPRGKTCLRQKWKCKRIIETIYIHLIKAAIIFFLCFHQTSGGRHPEEHSKLPKVADMALVEDVDSSQTPT